MITRLILKGVRSHLLRFLLTAASVTLGVSLVAGTFVLTDSMNATFDKIFTQASVGLDVQVRGIQGAEGLQGGNAPRASLPITLADTLKQVDGVQRAVPDLQGNALLVGKDGTAVRSGGAPTFGFAYSADDQAFKLVGGRPPSGPNEVAVESSTLSRAKLSVGDRTRALIGNTPHDVTITGEISFTALAGATAVLVDEQTARKEFAPDGTVTTFSVRAAKGVSQQQLLDRVRPLLPTDAEAVTGQKVTDENRDSIGTALGFIQTFLLVFAFVSLFVGAFIIANTFSMLVAQRTRELALLRAVGASRPQVIRVVLGEATVVGLGGAVLGLGVGVGLAAGLQVLFRTLLGLDISGGLPVAVRTVVWSFAVGVLVTVLSAVIPAARAARVPPVAAMRDDIALPVRRIWVRGGVGVGMMAIGGGLLVPAIGGSDIRWPLFGLAASLVVLGTVIAAPLVTRPVIRVVGWPFVLLAGAVGRLARENGLRNPRRTASTAAALMIGLALIAAISVVATSVKASVADLVAKQLTADFVLNGGGQVQFPPAVAERAAKLPDVASVATIGAVPVQIGDKTSFGISAQAQAIADNVKVTMRSGALQTLDAGQMLVDESTAKDRGWKVGSTVKATVGTLRDRSLTVGGIYADNQVLGGNLIVPRSLYRQAIPVAQQGDFLVYLKARPGADLAALKATLVSEVKPFIVVSVQDGGEFVSSQADQINTLLNLIYVLLALSVIIAVLGIINTLALSVFERTREIGLLRAVGLSRRQLSSTITIEAVSTAVFGALLGTALGLGLGIALQHALAGQGLDTLSIPWGTLLAVILAAAVAGVFAALLPALRAVRLDVLRAITTD